MSNHFSSNDLYRGFDYQRTKPLLGSAPAVRVLPGGVYCTKQTEIISTGLGSCIAVCAWDHQVGIGGLNHFLLPFSDRGEEENWSAANAISVPSRYGNFAMEILLNQLIELGARRERLNFKLFGGALMMGKQSMIGAKNVEFVMDYMAKECLPILNHDLGGNEPRKIIFDPQSGQVWLKRLPFKEAKSVYLAEGNYAQRAGQRAHIETDEGEIF